MLFVLTSALAAVSNLHFFDDHHHFITHSSSRTSSFVSAHPHGGYGMGRGWVGGWGGIMTFGTTTGHIVSVDDHHHFITHSSCHYSPLTHFITISSRYSGRDLVCSQNFRGLCFRVWMFLLSFRLGTEVETHLRVVWRRGPKRTPLSIFASAVKDPKIKDPL